VQRVRLIAVAVGLAGLLGAFAPGVASSAEHAAGDCGRVEYASGLEVVFGPRYSTQARAEAQRRDVLARGFLNANIIPGCDGYRVSIRGMETWDVAVELQNEARREQFPATIECIKGKEIGRLEAIFGHGRDRDAAQAIVDRAAASGYLGLKLRPDPCGGFEVYVAGFNDRAEAEVFKAEAKDRGFTVAIEIN
jgi:hypothetical protein